MPYKNQQSEAARESQSKRNRTYYFKNKGKKIEVIVPEFSVCSACKKKKHKSEFYERKDRRSGLTSWCAVCLKRHNEKYADRSKMVRVNRTYGITTEQYNELLSCCNNSCQICGRAERLCVDHNHNSGKIRGILCRNCNVLIGNAKDNIGTLKNAIAYLLKTA